MTRLGVGMPTSASASMVSNATISDHDALNGQAGRIGKVQDEIGFFTMSSAASASHMSVRNT